MQQEPIPFNLALASIDLIIEGLAELPYKRVAGLISGIGAHVQNVQAERIARVESIGQGAGEAQPQVAEPATAQPAPRRLTKNRRAR